MEAKKANIRHADEFSALIIVSEIHEKQSIIMHQREIHEVYERVYVWRLEQ